MRDQQRPDVAKNVTDTGHTTYTAHCPITTCRVSTTSTAPRAALTELYGHALASHDLTVVNRYEWQ